MCSAAAPLLLTVLKLSGFQQEYNLQSQVHKYWRLSTSCSHHHHLLSEVLLLVRPEREKDFAVSSVTLHWKDVSVKSFPLPL